MLSRKCPGVVRAVLLAGMALLCGCASYKGLVKPVGKMTALSPELAQLTDAKIEQYLKANPQPSFPSVLAVARLASSDYWSRNDSQSLDVIGGDEAAGWRRMAEASDQGSAAPINQVQFINPILVSRKPTLKDLRDAAARLHAPLLLVYSQADTRDDGYNSAAMAYWTIVGLFLVPGNTVGYYSVCHGVLVDTRTGGILATIEGESKREEQVLPGAVDIAKRRTEKQARAEAVARFQMRFSGAVTSLAISAILPRDAAEEPHEANAARRSASEASGTGGSGNTWFAMRRTSSGSATTSTTIR
ncbi:MAG: hypothetical protein JXQ75_00220 [Phycisphaerae bacterium]|nr:hypothetical protein [Phycisphaerae bacterium]